MKKIIRRLVNFIEYHAGWGSYDYDDPYDTSTDPLGPLYSWMMPKKKA